MRPNKVKDMWQRGGAAVNGWLTLPSPLLAETLAHQAFDSITVDMQHGAIDYQDAWSMLTAISTTETVPMVRVPWRDPGMIMKMLDAGAYGIVCPMINTAAEAEELVSVCKYAPRGTRSYGPLRARLYGGLDYQANANDTVIVMAMIETSRGVDNVEEIAAVEGLDALYIGPSDLSLAMGYPPSFDHEPGPVFDVIDHILGAAKDAGIVAGIHNGTPRYARRMIEHGFSLVSLATDLSLLQAKVAESLVTLRGS